MSRRVGLGGVIIAWAGWLGWVNMPGHAGLRGVAISRNRRVSSMTVARPVRLGRFIIPRLSGFRRSSASRCTWFRSIAMACTRRRVGVVTMAIPRVARLGRLVVTRPIRFWGLFVSRNRRIRFMATRTIRLWWFSIPLARWGRIWRLIIARDFRLWRNSVVSISFGRFIMVTTSTRGFVVVSSFSGRLIVVCVALHFASATCINRSAFTHLTSLGVM
jgi:hypothetical protein